MKPEDICLEVQNDRLTISGETSAAATRDEGNFVVRERSYGKFSRTLVLPPGTKVCDTSLNGPRLIWLTMVVSFKIQPEDVKANLDSGVLTVTFPKAPSDQLPKRISIT